MNIGFMGAGKMAEAMIAGIVKSGIADPAAIYAGELNPERRLQMARRYGINCTDANGAVAKTADIIVLAVKPQQIEELILGLVPRPGPHQLVISIAAGKRLAWLAELLPAARLVRVMPNIACLAGEGMSVFTRGPGATDADAATVKRLLEAFGRAREMPEELFDAVTALSGSGPAFFAHLLDRVVDGAVAEGMPREAAFALARQTMLGTARLLAEGGMTTRELIDAVTSARGTTAAGRAVLENSDVGDVLVATIRAAAARSRELGGAPATGQPAPPK